MRRLAASRRPAVLARRSAEPSPQYRRTRTTLAAPAQRGIHPFSPGPGSRLCVPPPPLSPPLAPTSLTAYLMKAVGDAKPRVRETVSTSFNTRSENLID